MKIPQDTPLAGKSFFHGLCSPSDAVLADIMREGLKPKSLLEGKTGRGHLDPVTNRVYLTQELSYALIYAAGGCYAGCKASSLPERQKQPDAKGYVFAVLGKNLADVQPDEDNVGEVLYYSRGDNLEYGLQSPLVHDHMRQLLTAYRDATPHIRYSLSYAFESLTDRQKKRIEQGHIAGLASGGKRAIKAMGSPLKDWFVTNGANVAHEGPAAPVEAWSFPLASLPEMKPDGSNFYEIAQRVTLTAPLPAKMNGDTDPLADAYFPTADDSPSARNELAL